MPCRGGATQRWTFPSPGEEKLVTCFYGLSQLADLCPAFALLGHSSRYGLTALAQAGAADGAALPVGGEDVKKNLAVMGISCVFLGREELGGCKAFLLGSGCRFMPGRAGRCPSTCDLGELCSGLQSAVS